MLTPEMKIVKDLSLLMELNTSPRYLDQRLDSAQQFRQAAMQLQLLSQARSTMVKVVVTITETEL